MKVFSTFLLSIFLLITPTPSISSPLNIDIKKEHTHVPNIPGFRYWYGGVDYGLAVYLGIEDLSGFETEAHLEFKQKKVSKVLLILGPAGLTSDSCLRDYKSVVNLLNKKYGHYTNQNIVKDPLVDDLIYYSPCTPVRNDLYTVHTFWKLKDYRITTTLIGDSEGYYIEVEYVVQHTDNRKLLPLSKAL